MGGDREVCVTPSEADTESVRTGRPMTVDTVLLVGAVALGAIVGSFLNVVIYRLPRGEFFSRGARCVCPACSAPIAWFDNLPLFGWLLLRGQARCCGARISVRYPFVEVLTALSFCLLWVVPPSHLLFRDGSFAAPALLAFAFHAFFVANLIANTFIDFDHRILPDALTKPGMVAGCLYGLLVAAPGHQFAVPGLGAAISGLLFSLAGLATGFGMTWLVRAGARLVFGKEAMGFGDVKLMGMIGAFLGWQDVLLTFFVGCVIGAVFGLVHRWLTGDAYISFGPFLAIGAAVSLFIASELKNALAAVQRWQIESEHAPLVMVTVLVVAVFLLIVLVRRGRR